MRRALLGHLGLSHSGDFAANTGHLALFAMAYFSRNTVISIGVLVLIAALSLYGWIYNLRRGRAIADIAPSSINSAAQGYVELNGRSSVHADNMVVSPLSGTRCVWFRYIVSEKVGDNWQVMSEGISPYTIQIDDGTGTCQVDADGAEVIGATRRVSYDGSCKNEELILYGGSNLYVLGEFSTIGGAASALNLKEDVGDLLASWKQDKAQLFRRFDLDKDGEIDLREWELARREAVKQVQQQHREIRATSGTHIMRAPRDKKLYLISTLSPQKLRGRFMLWAMFHLLVLFVAASFAISTWHSNQALFS